MEPLTDEEFARSGLHPSLRDFAYWDENGWLTTIHCHEGALKQLMPITLQFPGITIDERNHPVKTLTEPADPSIGFMIRHISKESP